MKAVVCAVPFGLAFAIPVIAREPGAHPGTFSIAAEPQTTCYTINDLGKKISIPCTSPSESEAKTGLLSLPINVDDILRIDKLVTFWIQGYYDPNSLICGPATVLKVSNITNTTVSEATFSVTFLDPIAKTVWAGGLGAFGTIAGGELPPSYSRYITVVGDRGLDPCPTTVPQVTMVMSIRPETSKEMSLPEIPVEQRTILYIQGVTSPQSLANTLSQ